MTQKPLPLENIKVQSSGVIRGFEAAGLGRLNVVCGRNNSGKSTILQLLASADAQLRGSASESIALPPLIQAIARATGWRGDQIYPGENQQLATLVTNVVNERPVWYECDVDEFTNAVTTHYQANPHLARWAFGPSTVADAYRSLFGQRPKVLLLPPKRHLELAKQIATSESPSADGSGLLNFVFYARSQPQSSTEYRLYSELLAAFQSISLGYRFQAFPDRSNVLALRFALGNGSWIPAESCGLGLQDLLIILYFAIAPSCEVLLIEEPESHLHPELQRRLLGYLKASTSKQYFVTTHSNVFLDSAFVDKVLFSTFDGQIKVDDATSRASVLSDLGYSVADNLVSDLVILVEGPTDVPLVEEFLVKRGLYSRYDIRLWPLGGDIMDQLDLAVFSQRYQLMALIDQDSKSDKVRRNFIARCEAAGIRCFRLKRYAIENYLSLGALRKVFGAQIPASVTALDPKIPLEAQIGISVKRNNRKLAKEMSLEEIAGTDLCTFLDEVEALCAKKDAPVVASRAAST